MHDLYDGLVRWYRSKSLRFHVGALAVIVIVLLIEAIAVFASPPGWPDLTGGTGSSLPGYEEYTPVYWLIALATGLVAAFICRYSKVLNLEGRASRLARRTEEVTLLPWVQALIATVTVVALIVEVYGLATNTFTISKWTRSQAIAFAPLYWLFGLVAAFLAGALVDLKALPQVLKLMMVVWVAVLAHIFWWITP